MRNKIIFSILFLTCSCLVLSQERFGGTEKAVNRLKNGTLQVSVGDIGSDELDESLKNAFDKYWNFCPVEFVGKNELDKDKPALVLANYVVKSWTKYYYTKIGIENTTWLSFMSHFDDLTIKEKNIGIDEGLEAHKYKLNLLIMSLNAQAKFLHDAYAQNKTKGINDWDGYKERLKTRTVLIPQEYLSNGITKNAFKKIGKHEIVPLAEIAKRMEENNGKGYAVLNTYVSVNGTFFNIIDLETGDFIYRQDIEGPFPKGMTGMPNLITDKVIIKCIEKMNEK